MPTFKRYENGVPIWDPGDGSDFADFYGNLPPPPVEPEVPFDPTEGAVAKRALPAGYANTLTMNPQNPMSQIEDQREVPDSPMMSVDPGSSVRAQVRAREMGEQAASPINNPPEPLPGQFDNPDPRVASPAGQGPPPGLDLPMVRTPYIPAQEEKWLDQGRVQKLDDATKSEVDSQFAKAYASREKANELQAEHDANSAAERWDLARANALEAERKLEEDRREAADTEARYAAQKQIIDTNQKELDDYKIDPNSRYRGEDGQGRKVLDALAIGLGAMGAAFLKSGQNVGLMAVESSIARDIQEQELERERLKGKRDGAINDLDRLIEQGITPRAAKAMIRASTLAFAKAEHDAMMARTAMNATVPQAAEQRAALEEAHANAMLERELATADHVSQVKQHERAAVAAGQRPMNAKELKNHIELQKLQQQAANPGSFAVDEKQLEKFGKASEDGWKGKNAVDVSLSEIQKWKRPDGTTPGIDGIESYVPDSMVGVATSVGLTGEGSKSVRNALGITQEKLLRIATGAVAPPEEKAEARMLYSGLTDLTSDTGQVEDYLKRSQSLFNKQIRRAAASHGGNAVLQEWNRRRQGVVVPSDTIEFQDSRTKAD